MSSFQYHLHFLALHRTVAVILHAGMSCCFHRMILKSTVFLLNFIITLELYGSDAYSTGLVKTHHALDKLKYLYPASLMVLPQSSRSSTP